jgi:Holliday junction resolvasome RuvABC endonuclease subunit
MIIAIDPGTKTGITETDGKKFDTQLWNIKAKAKTKTRPAEPRHMRLLHLWKNLIDHDYVDTIVYEGAEGFMRGKAAIEVSHKLRAIIELFAALNMINLVMIQPNDLKQFALGKRSGSKEEMIQAAQRMGYKGNQDDEADSYLIAKWYCKHYLARR